MFNYSEHQELENISFRIVFQKLIKYIKNKNLIKKEKSYKKSK